jgi:YVTN family beta-propeller protein
MYERQGRIKSRVLSSFAAILLTASSAACSHSSKASPLPLVAIGDVPLPGHTTRWDYATLDPKTHHLFIAHLGDSMVTVFDTQTQKVVADIADVSDVHGVLAVPEVGRVYASATGTNEVVVIDGNTLKITARMPAGDYPDGMAYAPDVHKLYVSDEHGGADTVIDVRTNARVATIPLGGEVGNTQYDPVSKHIFANVQTRKQLVEIDPTTDKVIARIDLPGAAGNHGLLIEPKERLAFIACEDNRTLLVLNMTTRRVIASFKVGPDPDVLAFDPGLGWLYVAGEAGIVSVFKVQSGVVSKIGEGQLGPYAHVVAVNPATHRAYFPLKDVDGKPVLRITDARL